MSRPPVFTNRCCKLVSDHFPIGAGSASRRGHRADERRDDRRGDCNIISACCAARRHCAAGSAALGI